MPIINGKEIELTIPMADGSMDSRDWRINELLLALDGLSFEKKEEQKPFSVENPPEPSDRYYYLKIAMGEAKVSEAIFNSGYDRFNLTQNNCYRTKEEAEAALSRVLQSLKS